MHDSLLTYYYLGTMEVVAWLFLCMLAGAGFGKGRPGEQEPRNDHPNIVFMMADDMGYGDVGYNGGRADTPNLDAMAIGNTSILLTRYYSGGPVCSPTRGTVLTGRNHNRYCVWTANAGFKFDDFECPETMPLPTSEVTIADILEKNGYRTAIFGKWHLGDLKPLFGGNQKWPVSHPGMHGFDKWWVTERSTPTSNPNCGCFDTAMCPRGHYTDDPPCTNYYTQDPDTELLVPFSQPINGDDSHFILKEFSIFLDDVAQNREPFFVYLPFHTVHIRYIATMGYNERYISRGYSLEDTDYYGALTAMDDVVGQIRALLKQYNVSNNTMLWFTSDNGPDDDQPGVTAGFRGRKHTLWEGGIRVPGIIEWPDMIKTNVKSDFPVVSSDLLPTVCDILGVDPPQDRPIDGISVLPFINGQTSSRNKSIAWAFHIPGDFNGSYSAVLSGDQYKVYVNYSSGEAVAGYLFDLINDPFETQDISSLHPDIYKAMAAELETWRLSVIQSAEKEVGCYGYSEVAQYPRQGYKNHDNPNTYSCI